MESDAGRRSPGLTVAIIAAQPLMRAGIQMILQQDPTILVIDGGTCDVQVIDDWLGLRRRGLVALPPTPAASVAVVGDLDRPDFLTLLRHRVLCVADRHGPTDDLLRAVHAAAHGAAFVAARFIPVLTELASLEPGGSPGARAARLSRLTTRERQVLDLVCQGLPNQQIADTLNISVKTAKFHVSNVLSKLGYRTRSQLIAAVVAAGRPDRA